MEHIAPTPHAAPSARGMNAYQYKHDDDNALGLSSNVDRFHALRVVKGLGRDYGFTPSMIQLLEYYIVRTQDIDWRVGQSPICYQSVNATARDLCLTERQINNLETALFRLGVLRWEASGNNKRYGVRDRRTGHIAYAFGVDLSPLAELLPKLEGELSYKHDIAALWTEKRRAISAQRAQIRALLTSLLEGGCDSDMIQSCQMAYQDISYRIRSHHSLVDLNDLEVKHDSILEQLNSLYDDVYKDHMTVNNTATDAQYFRHIQNTNILKSSKEDTCSNPADNMDFQKSKCWISKQDDETSQPVARSGGGNIGEDGLTVPKIENITWKQVLNAASDRYRTYLPMHDRGMNWCDIVEAADRLRPDLGIHRSVWADACATLGRNPAAICIMIIDRKHLAGEVLSPGGYLREMCKRARRGELNLLASVFGLLNREDNGHDA